MVLLLTMLDGLVAAPADDVALDAPRSAELGMPVALSIGARFAGALAPLRAEAILAGNPELMPGGRARASLASDGNGLAGAFAIEPLRRGTLQLDRLWLRWPGPLGLAWRQRVSDPDRSVAILPDIGPVRSPQLHVFLKDALFGLLTRRFRDDGSEFEALTDYQPGMDRRAIDWKVSARHAKLLAKEFEAERNNQIVFAIDAGSDMCEPVAGLPRLDRAITAALITGYAALKAGDRVRLFAFAARPEAATPFVSNSRNFHRLQAEAARIDYRHQETNYTLALSTLAGQLQRRSLIVIFTDFTDPTSAELMLESVGRLIDRHLLLFVVMEDEELMTLIDRRPEADSDIAESVTAAGLLAQRRLVIARLRHMGIAVVEGRHDVIGTRLLNAYLAIKQRGAL